MTATALNEARKKKDAKADVGSVFISNYPPFSVWSPDQIPRVEEAMNAPGDPETPLGLYLHIPFCRKRCKFCYFKVYTDQNSKQIQAYLDAVHQELRMLSEMPAIKGRPLKFVYFGGGTPSFISARHMRALVDMLRERLPWDEVEEFTFECEPGTLTQAKLSAIHDAGVTRLSLGVENFDDAILEENGRAHISTEVYRVRPWIKEQHFGQLNIDLISGMVGETWDNWKANIQKAIDYDPDSVTIYQMELPFNTVYSKGLLSGEDGVPDFANWDTKRAWHSYAIDTLQAAGFEISSGYTMVKKDRNVKFRYRDALWRGADLLAVGVSSFGHLQGVHYQNDPSIERYNQLLADGKLPLKRAYRTTARDRLTREMILQLKLGRIEAAYFRQKFDADILELFADIWRGYEEDGLLKVECDAVVLTRDGLLRVDSLLPAFYEDRYRDVRYT